MDDTPTWRRDGDRLTLWYLGYPLVICQASEGGVDVRTRAYSEGYQQGRTMATLQGAQRYGDAWLAKWGDEAKRAVHNKIAAAEAERNRGPLLDAFGNPYPKIEVKPRRPRKRSR
jgi:hypothetical protein